MAKTRYKIIEKEAPHFLTVTILNWIPIFTNPQTVTIVLDSLKFLQAENRIILYGYVIMVNHLHLIVESQELAKEIGNFKSFTARKIIDDLIAENKWQILEQLNFYKLRYKSDRDFQLWQEGSHPQAILTDKMMRQKLTYIHNNPVKRGYVDDPVHWRYSSARNYHGGGECLLKLTTAW